VTGTRLAHPFSSLLIRRTLNLVFIKPHLIKFYSLTLDRKKILYKEQTSNTKRKCRLVVLSYLTPLVLKDKGLKEKRKALTSGEPYYRCIDVSTELVDLNLL